MLLEKIKVILIFLNRVHVGETEERRGKGMGRGGNEREGRARMVRFGKERKAEERKRKGRKG